jgi:hypothetical protein
MKLNYKEGLQRILNIFLTIWVGFGVYFIIDILNRSSRQKEDLLMIISIFFILPLVLRFLILYVIKGFKKNY